MDPDPARSVDPDVRTPLVGRRLGVYEVQAPLGAGATGEVYRARDTRLGRDVAIKVPPHAFATDPERRARFEREAHLLAALNHPHIAAIHGIEESGGITALVLELVEGTTLEERIGAGRADGLSIEDALDIGRQIAEALEAAHESGIIHRDLKPANIKITPEGAAKVLDFGLAKAVGATPATAADLSTELGVGTEDGRIIGTVTYMSPEQARGRTVDRRTDIWAYGCVLFEMLSGQRAFARGHGVGHHRRDHPAGARVGPPARDDARPGAPPAAAVPREGSQNPAA